MSRADSPNRTPFEERTRIAEWLRERAQDAWDQSQRSYTHGVFDEKISDFWKREYASLRTAAALIESCEHWVGPRGTSGSHGE